MNSLILLSFLPICLYVFDNENTKLKLELYQIQHTGVPYHSLYGVTVSKQNPLQLSYQTFRLTFESQTIVQVKKFNLQFASLATSAKFATMGFTYLLIQHWRLHTKLNNFQTCSQ